MRFTLSGRAIVFLPWNLCSVRGEPYRGDGATCVVLQLGGVAACSHDIVGVPGFYCSEIRVQIELLQTELAKAITVLHPVRPTQGVS